VKVRNHVRVGPWGRPGFPFLAPKVGPTTTGCYGHKPGFLPIGGVGLGQPRMCQPALPNWGGPSGHSLDRRRASSEVPIFLEELGLHSFSYQRFPYYSNGWGGPGPPSPMRFSKFKWISFFHGTTLFTERVNLCGAPSRHFIHSQSLPL
jgi:hypothetical protein